MGMDFWVPCALQDWKLLEFLSLPHCQMWQQDVTAVVTYRRMEQLALWRSFCKSTYRCDFVYEKFPEPIPRQMQRKTRSPTVPFLSLFFLFWGVLAGRIQKNMEVAHLRQRLLDTTSCDALADDEPLIIGKDAPPRLGKCSDPLLQATAEKWKRIYSSFHCPKSWVQIKSTKQKNTESTGHMKKSIKKVYIFRFKFNLFGVKLTFKAISLVLLYIIMYFF